MNLLSPMLSTATLSLHDYRLVPFLVALGFRLGILPEPPPALEFTASLPALAVTGALAALGIATRGKPARRSLRRLERTAGIPLASAAILAAGSVSAVSADIEGTLLGSDSSTAAWADPASYGAIDLLVIATVGLFAPPFALLGKLQREFLRRLPLPKPRVMQVSVASMGVAAAVVSRLPAAVQLPFVAMALVLTVLLGAGILRRAAQLLRWFASARGVTPRQKGLVLAEILLTGLGLLLAGSAAGILRLAVGVVLVLALLFVGLAVLPLYAYVGLGGALRVTRRLFGSANPRRRPGRVRSRPGACAPHPGARG